MADGVTYQTSTLASPPDTTEVATDDAGAAGHVQIIKLAVDTDGSATVIPAHSTNGLGVDIKQSVALALDATTLAALETIGLDATTLAALESITIGTALPAGANAIGKLAANSGVDIGDVDVTSSALPTGASTAAKQDTMIGHLDGVEAALAAVQTAVEILDNAIAGSEIQADVLTLPSIPAGNNNIGDVDVASSALPSGASTAAKQDTAQTALDAIKTAAEILDNTVAGSELQVDVVGALPAGSANIGDVDVASIAAGDNNIGNVDVVTLPALVAGSAAIGKLAANSGVDIGDVDVLTQPARVATTDTITAKLATDKIQDGVTALTPKFAVIDAAGSGDNTLLAAVSSKKIRVLSAFLISAGTVNARFESGTGGTALSGQMNLVANSGFVLPFNPVGWFETAATTLLNLELSGAVSVDGSFTYVEVA